jgi:hypothetical protein
MVTHVAEAHRVRIFVVPDSVLEGEPLPLGRDRPVTPRHLERSRSHIKQVAEDLLDDSAAVIVVGDKAATFICGALVPHDYAIRHAAIRMYTDSDTIAWECDQPFTIVSTEKVTEPIWCANGTPDNPFYSGPPFCGQPVGNGCFRAESSMTMAAANGQQYKVSIMIGDRLIDPDYVCGSPPPSG